MIILFVAKAAALLGATTPMERANFRSEEMPAPRVKAGSMSRSFSRSVMVVERRDYEMPMIAPSGDCSLVTV